MTDITDNQLFLNKNTDYFLESQIFIIDDKFSFNINITHKPMIK